MSNNKKAGQKANRYKQIIAHVFNKYYKPGATEFGKNDLILLGLNWLLFVVTQLLLRTDFDRPAVGTFAVQVAVLGGQLWRLVSVLGWLPPEYRPGKGYYLG